VPIPANVDTASTIGVGLWFPAWQLGQERASPYGTTGGQILFNAEWIPSPGADKSPIEFLRRTLPVRAGDAFAPLLCAAGAPCIGSFLLQNLNARLLRLARAKHGADVLDKKKPLVRFAKKKFKIKAGKKKTIEIPLNQRGERLLRGRSKAKVWARVKLKGYAADAVPPVRVTLKKKG
jgi:hypothetical protein